MHIVFRKIPYAHPPPPGEGELLIFPGPDHPDRLRAVTQLVLEAGPEALRGDPRAPDTLVVASYPTLDDMLACEVVRRRLEGQPTPEGLPPFASYASLLREGLTPPGVPARRSLQGVFQAISSLHPPEPDDPTTWPPFLEAWAPLAEALFQAAEDGQDPFGDDLLAGRAELQRAFAFLEQDQDVFRQDVARGERWIGRIPGIDRHASALILREPRSALFKLWSRREPDPETGQPTTLLGISWRPGDWTFSTDPARKIPLADLHQRLDQAEAGSFPDGEEPREWFDGAVFEHTLISAPEDGSRLDDDRILGVVRGWFEPSPPALPRALHRRPLTAAILVAAILLVGVRLWRPWADSGGEKAEGASAEQVTTPPQGRGDTPERIRGARRADGRTPPEPGIIEYGKQYLLLIGISEYPEDSEWWRLPGVAADREAVEEVLTERYVYDWVLRLYDEEATQARISTELDTLASMEGTENDSLLIYYAGHGHHDRTAQRSYWIPYDGGPEGPEARNWLAHHKVQGYLNTMGFRHVLIVSDACFSGVFVKKGRTLHDRAPDALVRAYGKRARQALLSGLDEPVADAAYGDLSPFARPLVTFLRSHEEPVLDARDVGHQVRKSMQEASVKQTPLFDEIPNTDHTDGATYLFIRRMPGTEALPPDGNE